MLRPSEIIDMKITDTDEGNDKINYLNVVSKKIVINNHKNDRKGPKIINITDNKLNGILWKGLNQYLITNHNNEIYTCNSGFSKMFKNNFDNHNPYDLRMSRRIWRKIAHNIDHNIANEPTNPH
jgi:hypothetical protein